MNKFHLLALFSLVCLAGCDTATKPIVTGYPPTDPAAVKILEHYPKRDYLTLGPVSVEGAYSPSGSGASRLDMGDGTDFLGDLRNQAGAMGADAVILKEKDVFDPQDPSGTGGNDPGNSRRMRLAGIAIKWKPAAAPAPSAKP